MISTFIDNHWREKSMALPVDSGGRKNTEMDV
jgi:hypothetical protein